MPTILEQIQSLESKIVEKKQIIADLNYSIDAVKNSIVDPQGCTPAVAWVENQPQPAYIGPNASLCSRYWLALGTMTIAVRKAESDIKAMESSIETLKKDPSVKDYYENKAITKYVVITLIVLVVISISIWAYKKYAK